MWVSSHSNDIRMLSKPIIEALTMVLGLQRMIYDLHLYGCVYIMY